ncbi:MAG: HD domain-containing protein, partial [Deltaproteobacteria bacterium]|nr:HD domain-containing protein [Deltaproteobacteria bacterium]
MLQYQPAVDVEPLREAYRFTAKVHEGQKRLSGEPYVTHPVAVAGILADLKLDLPSIIGGMLHDTVEDTLATLPQIEEQFGPEVAALVDGVTKLSQVNFNSREEKQAENFRKMILAMAKDIRVVLIKLADRTHNMRTLQYLPDEKQRRIAQETLDIYAPIAHRLGIYWIKSELEDLALKYLRPEVYAELKHNVAQKKKYREKYTNDVISRMSKALAEEGIDGEVSGRPKHFFSIFRKMENQSLD